MAIKKYTWSYNEKLTLDEYIKRLAPLITEPVGSLQDMEGDMLLSDYRTLTEGYWRFKNLIEEMEKK
jgi:hypothetical protein